MILSAPSLSTARNSCIVSFQWLFTVLQGQKMVQHVLEIHCLYEFWFDLRLDSCQAASPRRCPEGWLNLRFLLFPWLWSALFALVTDTSKGGTRRRWRVLLPHKEISTLLSVRSANTNRSAAPIIKRRYKFVDWQHLLVHDGGHHYND